MNTRTPIFMRGVRCVVALTGLATLPAWAQQAPAAHDMSGMDHSKMDHAHMAQEPQLPATVELPPGIPPVTDADRAAAFPQLAGMSDFMNDDPINYLVLFDRLELRDAKGATPLLWDVKAWIGSDRNRLYLRSEGEAINGTTEEAGVEALWVRPVSRWWNLALGLRNDFRPRDSRSWLAVGTIGLAPYRIGVQATAYLGDAGRTAFRLETDYDLLLTNRLILAPRLQLNAYGADDPARGIGSGVSKLELGLRLRYEIRREIAPYAGVAWVKLFGTTADLARTAGREAEELQAVAGLRFWF